MGVLTNGAGLDMSRPGMTLGLAIASTWYWCLDQEMAQRVLSSKNLDHAQIGCATAGYLKILPVLLTGRHNARPRANCLRVFLTYTTKRCIMIRPRQEHSCFSFFRGDPSGSW